MITFHVYPARDGYRWRCRSRNGRSIAESGEAYTRRRDCLDAVRRMLAQVLARKWQIRVDG